MNVLMLNVLMLNVLMLNVLMLNVLMLSVIRLNVVKPSAVASLSSNICGLGSNLRVEFRKFYDREVGKKLMWILLIISRPTFFSLW